MTEPVEWRADGTPLSLRFGDVYRSESGGFAQSRHVFLQGCGLPQAWQGQPRWVILETGFGLGLNFLSSWQTWRNDPLRPQRLHFVSIEAWPTAASDVLRNATSHPELMPLAEQLAAQWWGLAPGFHRLEFEQGRVVLTLCIGDIKPMLRELQLQADSVFLDGFSPQQNPDMWSEATLKGVARCCRRGTRLATWTIARAIRDGLTSLGFEVRKAPGLPPKRDCLEASYQPAWEPRRPPALTPMRPAGGARDCLVIGGGLAGASTAFALARRGWQVTVLDAADGPASGASGLPVGLFSPHVSSDDGRISQLTRSGLRITRHWAAELLPRGQDWAPTGVLEHRLHGKAGPRSVPASESSWSEEASAAQKQGAGLSPEAPVSWHRHAGWIRPAALVNALLKQESGRVRWRGGLRVEALQHQEGHWLALDALGQALGQAPWVVVAAGPGSAGLARPAIPLQPIRGQLSWAVAQDGERLPEVPVNGQGSFIPGPPNPEGQAAWYTGSTFDRLHPPPVPGDPTPCKSADQHSNFEKLARLLPVTAASLRSQPDSPSLQAWAGTRCTAPDRVPLVGPVGDDRPGLWMCTALGTRGLTWGMLCGELLACELEGEPLPVPLSHARALLASRPAAGRPDSTREE